MIRFGFLRVQAPCSFSLGMFEYIYITLEYIEIHISLKYFRAPGLPHHVKENGGYQILADFCQISIYS